TAFPTVAAAAGQLIAYLKYPGETGKNTDLALRVTFANEADMCIRYANVLMAVLNKRKELRNFLQIIVGGSQAEHRRVDINLASTSVADAIPVSRTSNANWRLDGCANHSHNFFVEKIPTSGIPPLNRNGTDKWVERSVILSKSQLHQYYSTHPTKILPGVIGTSANLPSSDIEVLSAGLSALGGQWRPALTREITHPFSLSPAGEKLGVRVPEEAYEWSNPAVLDNLGVALLDVESAANGRKLQLKGKDTWGEEEGMLSIAAKYTPDLHAPSSTPPPPPGEEEMQVEVWNGKRIMLSYILELGGSRRHDIEAGVIVHIEDGDEVSGTEEGEERRKKEKERDRRGARALDEGEGVVLPHFIVVLLFVLSAILLSSHTLPS
ncbi:hypothetical protein BDQ17DRAFT_1339990, partial [Cyathus striatus]